MGFSLSTFVADHYATGCGVCSICSSHPGVLESAVRRAVRDGSTLLVEATANQVDQNGGYTGMNPAQFRDHVLHMARQHGLDADRVVLGGDHLGPLTWRKEAAAIAMNKAETLVRAYVEAGFSKIHLDCSMSCADDAGPAPAPEVAAGRAARLCKAAEESARKAGLTPPVYVIGTEVPIPGGATHDLDHGVAVTNVQDAADMLDMHRRFFIQKGLEEPFERVIGLVVQPGVEFDHTSVVDYQSEHARELSHFAQKQGHLVFEAHSTDYQTPQALCTLVRDHFAILKVGPWLTWAWRQGLFALEAMEKELLPPERRSHLSETIAAVMQGDDRYWKDHYQGSADTVRLEQRFSYSDRVRYYWANSSLREAERTLCANIAEHGVPMPLLSQYMPKQYDLVREGLLENTPSALLFEAVGDVLDTYARAAKTL